MPVCAIESLILALTAARAQTYSETLDILATSVSQLKAAIPNSISLTAGTDIFQRYIAKELNKPQHATFDEGLRDLLGNAKTFAHNAKRDREKIAELGVGFVRDECTVLTNGGSRAVGALLRKAAEAQAGSVRFRVIYVVPATSSHAQEGCETVHALRSKGVPVAVIGEGAVGYAMGKVDMVIVGAEGVVENGGIISRLGTYQIALLSRAGQVKKPFYVVAETHKFVRLYPLGQFDLPIEQKVVDFRDRNEDGMEEEEDGEEVKTELEKENPFDKCEVKETNGVTNEKKVNSLASEALQENAVDLTPPDLITALITEKGVFTPSAVSEELIQLWY
jgi:translation initiation factor eIF-2B subunit alpha